MARIKFYRGLAEDYDRSIHGNGIYFTTDTFQIIHAGNSYGVVNELDFDDDIREFISDSLLGCIKDLFYSEESGEFSYMKKVKVTTTETTETGEVISKIFYRDEEVKFSVRNLVLGSVKNLAFSHASDGTGQISYKVVSEVTKKPEVGEAYKELTEEEKALTLPNSTYGEAIVDGKQTIKYYSGLMSGQDKENLDNLTTQVEEISESTTWLTPPEII